MKNEINDLYDYNYKIVQNSNYFKFSLDSILLADFVHVNLKDKKMIDLCTGNAPIPIILSGKISNIYGMEIQKKVFDLAMESVALNNIKNVNLINDNIENWNKYFNGKEFDIVTCNPPYFKYKKDSIICDNNIKAIARHEIATNLESVIKISSNLLKTKGRLFLVHRSSRLIELINILQKYNFGIKKLECCYNNSEYECSMILVEAMLDGKDDLKILKPLYTENYRR